MIDRIGNLNTSSESAGHQNTPKMTIEQQVKTEYLFETKRYFDFGSVNLKTIPVCPWFNVC